MRFSATILAALALLIFGAPAQARPLARGTPFARVQNATFGAETLSGFGGMVPTGLSGALTINSETNGSGGASTDFVVNTDYDGATGQIVPSGTYGTTHAAYNGPYTLKVTGAGGQSTTLILNIVPNQSTVKSQFGFATHGDAPGQTSFQLGKLLNSNSLVFLGDTIVMRNDCGCATGITPELNPQPLTTFSYGLRPPAGGYAAGSGTYGGGSRIGITCETINTSFDENTNPVNGGGCSVGSVTMDDTTAGASYSIPIDFNYVHFYLNWQVTPGLVPKNFMIGPGNNGNGWGCYHCRFELGPNVSFAEAYIFRMDGSQQSLGVIDHSTFVGPFFNHVTCLAPTIGGVLDSTDPCTITNNVFSGAGQAAISLNNNNGNPIWDYNFFFNAGTIPPIPAAGEYFIIGSTLYTWVNGAPTGANQVPIVTSWAQTIMNAACVVNGGGAIPYSISGGGTGNFNCVAGTNYWSGQTADPNVAVSQYFYSQPVYFFTVQARAVGTAGNSIGVHTGNPTYQTCSDAGVVSLGITNCSITSGVGAGTGATQSTWWVANTTGNANLVTSLAGGTATTAAVATLSFNYAHGDIMIFNSISTAGTYPGGENNFNIWSRGVEQANQGIQQGVFGNPLACCMVNRLVQNNIGLNGAGNQVYMENWTNPTVKFNTTLADVASDLYNPSAPNYDTFANPSWTAAISAEAIITNTCTSTCGGGTFLDNLSNNFVIGNQLGSPTSTPSPNESVGSFGTVWGSPQISQAGMIASMQLMFPHYQNAYQQNWTGVPGCKVGAGLCNRLAMIWAHTPAVGATFTGSITSGQKTLTVTSGVVPAQWTPINGPGIPSGDVAISVSGNVLTLLSAATATETAQTYGTLTMNPDGSYNGALWPANNSGNVCWNAGGVFNPATACTPAQ